MSRSTDKGFYPYPMWPIFWQISATTMEIWRKIRSTKHHIAAYKTAWDVITRSLPTCTHKFQYFFVTIDRLMILPLPHNYDPKSTNFSNSMKLWRKIWSTKHHIAAYKTILNVNISWLPTNKSRIFLCHDWPIKGFTPTPTVTQNRQISVRFSWNFDDKIRSTKHHIAAYKTAWDVITRSLPTHKFQYFFVTIDQ